MCTITFLPAQSAENDFIITHNRDESVMRPAEFPQQYAELGTQLFYPKDKTAGGTWIGISIKKRLVSLMNGAFKRHRRQPPYRKSRGVIVKELLASEEAVPFFKAYNFKGVEPFFALLFSWEDAVEIYELVWDGQKKHHTAVTAKKAHLWSSAMTYSQAQHQRKKKQFDRFIQAEKSAVQAQEIWDFHHRKKLGEEEGMLIDRGLLQTTSVSQFYHLPNQKNASFKYHDLLSDIEKTREIIWSKGT